MTVDSPRHLVLYDGVCGLCNGLNAFLLTRDRGLFAFASLQSQTGRSFLTRFGLPTDDLNTFYVIAEYESESPALLAKSRAGLFALRSLGGFWRAAGALTVLPTRLLDIGYDLIARNRYRWFGRYEVCPVPSPEHRRRFLDV